MRLIALLLATLLGFSPAGAEDGLLTPGANLQGVIDSAGDGAVIRPSAGRFRSGNATKSEIIVQPASDELPDDHDPQTLLLMEALARDSALRKRMRETAVEPAAGSDEAFDRLANLADEARRACGECLPLEDASNDGMEP